MELEFVECPACSVKPGTPLLCSSCVHNRDVIYQLKKLVDSYKAGLNKLEACIKGKAAHEEPRRHGDSQGS